MAKLEDNWIYKILRDLFQVVIVIPASIVIGLSMLLFYLFDARWRNCLDKFGTDSLVKVIFVWTPLLIFFSIFNMPARFFLRHFHGPWKKLVERAFVVGY